MVVAVTCPTCQTVLKAPPGLAGKKAKCKKCGGKFQIPGPPPVDDVGDTVTPSVMDTHAGTPEPPAVNPFDFSAPAPAAPPKPEPKKPDPRPSAPKLPPVSEKPSAKTAGTPAKPESKPAAPPVAEKPPAKPAVELPKKPPTPAPKPVADALPPDEEDDIPNAVAVDDLPGDDALPDDELPADPDDAPPPDPFAFAPGGTPAAAAPAKAAPAPPGGKPAAAPQPEPAATRRSYRRPGERKSRLPILVAGVLVLAVIGGGVAAVFKWKNAPAAVAKAPPTEPAPEALKDDAAKPDAPPADDAKGKTDDGGDQKKAATPPPRGKKGAPVAKTPTPAPETPAPKPLAPPPPGGKPGETVAVPDGVLVLPPAANRTFTLLPAPEKAAVFQKPVARVTAAIPAADVRRVIPPGETDAFAAVLWASSRGVAGFGGKYTLSRFNLKNGATVDQTVFDAGNRSGPPVCDLSADADFFAIAADGKITAHDFDAKAKALDAWNPYADMPDHAKAGLAAVFVGPGNKSLVTVTAGGAVHFWDIAKKASLGTFAPAAPPFEKLAAGRGIAVTGDHRTVAVAADGVIHLLDIASAGKKRGKLELGGAPIRSLALGVTANPDGSFKAVYAFETATAGLKAKESAVALLEPGKAGVNFFRLPPDFPEAASAGWAGELAPGLASAGGPAFLLRHGGDLLSGGKFAPVARVEPAGGKGAFGFGADHKLWYAVADPADAKKALLVGVELPLEADASEQFSELVEKKRTAATITAEPAGLGK